MKNTIFKGSGVAIATPFKDDGAVNYKALGDLIQFQIENETDCIVVCGTTGETPALTQSEHFDVIDYAVKKVNGKIPVVAGTGSNNTEHAVELSKKAEELGVNGLLVVTPYYNKTSQEGLVKHYNYIADSVNTPIIVYNVPSRTGCNILPQTYKKLAEHKNICAIKEANGDVSSVVKTLSLCGDEIDLYSGEDGQNLPIMALGGIGVISVFANICPKESHDLAMAMLKGDLLTARKIQIGYSALINELFSDVNPIPVKHALNLMGFNCGKCRLPLIEMNESKVENLKIELKKHGLIK